MWLRQPLQGPRGAGTHSDSVSMPGKARQAFAAALACRGLVEFPCPSLLPQACITCPGQAAHSCPPRGCRDLHVLFAKRCQLKLPLCHVAACATLQAEAPFHVAGQHVKRSCPKARASCQAGSHDWPAIATLSFTCSRAMMFLFWLSSGLGSVNSWHN